SDLLPLHTALPPRLWTMLSKHCPNLKELTLCSFSASNQFLELTPLIDACWPLLSSLTLGAFGYNPPDFSLAGPPVGFEAFLAAHSELTSLRLAWYFRWMSPDGLPPLRLPPMLSDFSGVAQQLTGVSSKTLTTLDLMYKPLYAPRVPALRATLAGLPALTSLGLWLHRPDPQAGYGALWDAVPTLEDLHFMCLTVFGRKPLTELAGALRHISRLRNFTLTMGHHHFAGEPMRVSATRFFSGVEMYNRTGLAQVGVRWVRAGCHNNLKQEGLYQRVASEDLVDAWEHGLRTVGGAFVRRY
ncbi:hypothetical protein B0H13DRAFT_1528265, partial [Mycena leptocephala]